MLLGISHGTAVCRLRVKVSEPLCVGQGCLAVRLDPAEGQGTPLVHKRGWVKDWKPPIMGHPGHLFRCVSGLQVSGGGNHLLRQRTAAEPDDLIGALGCLGRKVSGNKSQGCQHFRLCAWP